MREPDSPATLATEQPPDYLKDSALAYDAATDLVRAYASLPGGRDEVVELTGRLAMADPAIRSATLFLLAPGEAELSPAWQLPPPDRASDSCYVANLANEAFLTSQARSCFNGIHTQFALPIIAGGECLGVMVAHLLGRDQAMLARGRLEFLAGLAGLALRQAHAREAIRARLVRILRFVSNRLDDGIVVFDHTGQAIQVNEAARRLVGIENLGSVARLAAEWRQSGHPSQAHASQLTIDGPDDRRRYFRVHLLALSKHLGLSHGLVTAFLRDETQMEEARRRQEAFFGLATHELRNPLTVIKVYFDFFAAELSRHDSERLKRAMTTIRRNVERVLKLCQDMQDHTRLELGAFHYDRAEVSTDAILDAMIPEAQLLCASNGIELAVVINGKGIGFWDRLRVEQVLLNLITNAVKFSPAGSTLHLTASIIGSCWQVSVADEGIGLPEEELKSVFLPYYRSNHGRIDSAPGTGLGLAICQQLVQSHAGSIWAESPGRGQGCTFHFTLPLLASGGDT